MVSEKEIKEQLKFTLEKTDLNLGEKYEGKVRDNYTIGEKRIIITTDRLSAFDVVLCTLPFKGQVLNQISQFWFEKTKAIVPNHLISVPDPNVSIVRNCKIIPIEFIVRGYITGVTTTSMWYNYSRGTREFCGHKLPEGMKKDQKLETPIVTPTTKAEKGMHDELVSREDIIKRCLLDGDDFDSIAEASLKLFEHGTKIAAKNGIILVDTKYEFGRNEDGEIMLVDEIHTPDSSRFWHSDLYHDLLSKGEEQRKIDKEYVRKWLSDNGFIGKGNPPAVPDEVRVEAAKRYISAYETITGLKFNASVGDASSRIERNLRGWNGQV